MMADTAPLLRDLQAIDVRVAFAEKKLQRFDPLLEEVDEPVTVLETEAKRLRDRLKELRLEEKRLEGAADDKRARLARLAERLTLVRNLREEAAVHAETDMVRRATEADESEALHLLDQIRRLEERIVEVDEALKEAVEVVGPRRAEILSKREASARSLEKLRKDRTGCLDRLEEQTRRLYESIRAGGRTIAVAALTEDGACGHCYGFVPLQVQNEIVAGAQLLRCEACGVILTAPHPEGEEEMFEEDDDDGMTASATVGAVGEASDGDEEPSDDDAEVERVE